MTPADLGLPAKFTHWRVGQDDAIIDAASALTDGADPATGTTTRFYVSSQPTGAGKSAFYMGVSRLIGSRRTLILTATKNLQQQLVRDFGSMGVVEVKGQNNYPCLAVQRPTGLPDGIGGLHGMAPENAACDDGPCHAGVECELKQKGCRYFDQVRLAYNAEIVVTNYSYWMHCNRFGDAPIGCFDLLVLDEAHDAPDKLAEFVSIYLGASELRDLLDESLPPLDAGLDFWAEWAQVRLIHTKLELEAVKGVGHVRTVRALRNLASKLEDLSKAPQWRRGNPSVPNVWIPGAATDWVAEESSTGATFSPVWARGYAEKFLFADIKRVLLTSATIMPKTVSYLGVGPEQRVFNERPSTFPANRRPVYIIDGAVKVGNRMSRGEELSWINKIDLILSTRLDRKAIIHAVSYERARFIYEHSRFQQYMVVHSKRDAASQIERFRVARSPSILVSPTVREGYDFPYDQCELQIIAKIPFVDMRPAVIKARHKSDRLYTNYLAIMAIIQSAGRGMRAADDMCETFIVDGNIGWLMNSMRKSLPRWFKAAIRKVATVPPAPPRIKRLTR